MIIAHNQRHSPTGCHLGTGSRLAGGLPHTNDSSPGALAGPVMEFDMARHERTNVILIGPDACCRETIRVLRPYFLDPITTWQSRERLELPPPDGSGTLLLYGIDSLSWADQELLFRWLDSAFHVKVVSTAPLPLLPRVEDGTFLDTLYYRLNTVCFLRGDE